MTPTPREVPVREAPAWPHRPATDSPDTYCDHCDHPWPCPSQQWVDGLVAAVRALPSERIEGGGAIAPDEDDYEYAAVIGRAAVLLILEGARTTDG
jgi:hypothetical protein